MAINFVPPIRYLLDYDEKLLMWMPKSPRGCSFATSNASLDMPCHQAHHIVLTSPQQPPCEPLIYFLFTKDFLLHLLPTEFDRRRESKISPISFFIIYHAWENWENPKFTRRLLLKIDNETEATLVVWTPCPEKSESNLDNVIEIKYLNDKVHQSICFQLRLLQRKFLFWKCKSKLKLA